jgi:riboflavin kinase / FMN adenylyltransferase
MYLRRQFSSHSTTNITNSQAGVVTLGNFDGMHLGHCALIVALKKLAALNELTTHVVTFTPHPRDYFAKQGRGLPVLNISSVRNRLMYLNKMGVDYVHLLRFNQELATLSPQDFVLHVLVKACNAKHVLVGRDVRFGHQRAGDWALLCSLGEQYGFAVHCFEEVLDSAALRISSSAIRHDLYAGHLQDANLLLGYAYSLSGRVIHGKKLARTLNFPTLNINPHLPNPALRGVFVVQIEGLNSRSNPPRLYGVANLGIRPTVDQAQGFSLEVHVLDWSGDVYGLTVNITFLYKLRSEAVYANLPDLQHAIAQDVLNARQWLSVQMVS